MGAAKLTQRCPREGDLPIRWQPRRCCRPTLLRACVSSDNEVTELERLRVLLVACTMYNKASAGGVADSRRLIGPSKDVAMNAVTTGPSRLGDGKRRYRVGIDVGGTFTDVVLVEEETGRILGTKVHTVPTDPSAGCLAGVEKALQQYGIEPRQLSFIVHGTTVATNTIIENKGARAGLLTSEGFRDVLEIAYQTRPSLYEIDYVKTKPLIPRSRCLGIPERMSASGEVLVKLDEAALRAAVTQLLDGGVDSLAVAFLHSYKDATHERRAGEIIAEMAPDLPVVLSSSVCPEFREYPRTSTCVVNAVLLPIIGPYIGQLEARLSALGVTPPLHLMTSSGGIMTAEIAKRFPVYLVESGPAAGVIGAAFVGGLSGHANVLALDIGGTTAKAALIRDGRPHIAEQFEVGVAAVASATAPRGRGYPVLTPVISLVEIGTGGGSIAHVDPGGALKVGPQSAGAVPGPACYGRGGTAPTLTDANLVLGRINPDYFIGDEAALNLKLAEEAIATTIGASSGTDVYEAAHAIVEIANARMASALGFVSVEQGIDPRDFVLVPSGGAGPMLAAEIARKLGVRRVLVPPAPGLNSAVGLLATDLKHEKVRTFMRRTSVEDLATLPAILSAMEEECRALLVEEGIEPAEVQLSRQLDMSYVGQSYQLRIQAPDRFSPDDVAALIEAFHGRHAEAYGFANEGEPSQVVNVRVLAIGPVERPIMETLDPASTPIDRAINGHRKVYFGGGRWVDTPIYDRRRLLAGDRFEGPAIIEQMDTTIVIPQGTSVAVEASGSLLLDVATGPVGAPRLKRVREPAHASS